MRICGSLKMENPCSPSSFCGTQRDCKHGLSFQAALAGGLFGFGDFVHKARA